jgi:hypothetical protein
LLWLCWFYRFEFRGSAVGGDAFSSERPVRDISGVSRARVKQPKKQRSRLPFDDLLSGGGLYQQSKKSRPF